MMKDFDEAVWRAALGLLCLLTTALPVLTEAGPQPQDRSPETLFARALIAKGADYTAARDSVIDTGTRAQSYLREVAKSGKSDQERVLAQVLLARIGREAGFRKLETEFHRKVVAWSRTRPPGAPLGWTFDPVSRGIMLQDEVGRAVEQAHPDWSQESELHKALLAYCLGLSVERTAELSPFLLEVLLKGWWGAPTTPGPGAGDGQADLHRYPAADLLGKLKEQRAFPILLALFRSRTEDECMRAHAALGLGYLGDPRALPDLRDAFLAGAKQVSPDIWGNEVARRGYLLGELVREIRRPSAAKAGASLLEFRGPKAVSAWVEWLKSEDTHRRLLAVAFLGEIGGNAAMAPLREAAAADADEDVRRAAQAAIRRGR